MMAANVQTAVVMFLGTPSMKKLAVNVVTYGIAYRGTTMSAKTAKVVDPWQSMRTAPTEFKEHSFFRGRDVLGIDSGGEIMTIHWTTGYPHSEGVWSYGEASSCDCEDTDGIGETLIFYPVAWQELPTAKPSAETLKDSADFYKETAKKRR